MSSTITLKDIRSAAEQLGRSHAAVEAVAAACRTELEAACRPIYQRFQSAIDQAAEAKAEAHRMLMDLLNAAPQLFAKTPRSLSVDGVRAGYRKEQDSLDWDDDEIVIKRIRALIPDQAELLIRTEESVVVDGLAQLPANSLQALGVRRVPGVDSPFVTIGATELDALVKAIVAAAQQRQGEDEKPKKKGRAKVKETA